MIRITSDKGFRQFEVKNLQVVEVNGGKVTMRFSNGDFYLIEGKFRLNCDSTDEGEDFVRKFNLAELEVISAIKHGVPTEVTFAFKDGLEFTIIGAFNIGYSGTGPMGFYDIIREAGFKNADSVFIRDCTQVFYDRITH